MPRRQHFLIVEDDEQLQALLRAYLDQAGYQVTIASSGKEMHAALQAHTFDCVLLDLGLPDEDGIVLARRLRSRSTVPLVVVTARRDESALLATLEIGADDYIYKPFVPEELVLRLRNLLRRANAKNTSDGDEPLTISDLIIDDAGRTVEKIGQGLIDLSVSEYGLLLALASAKNRVLSRAQLLDAIASGGEEISERAIDVHVSRLRKKVEKDPSSPILIVTVPGVGYKLVSE